MQIYKKIILTIGLAFIMTGSLLTGCGQSQKSDETEWKAYSTIKEGEAAELKECISFPEFEAPDIEYEAELRKYDCYNEKLYVLCGYLQGKTCHYFLNVMDVATKDIVQQEFELDVENSVKMQVVSEDEVVFWTKQLDDDILKEYKALHYNMDGDFLYEVSMMEFYETYLPEYIEEIPNAILYNDYTFDAAGNCYFYEEASQCLFRIGSDGKGAVVADCAKEGIGNVEAFIRMPDESVVFLAEDGAKNSFYRIVPESGETLLLGEVEDLVYDTIFAGDGVLYIVYGGRLSCWDVSTGEREKIFSLDGSYGDSRELVPAVDGEGNILMYCFEHEEGCVYVIETAN